MQGQSSKPIVQIFFISITLLLFSCNNDKKTGLQFSHQKTICVSEKESLYRFDIGNTHYQALYSDNEWKVLINDSTTKSIQFSQLPEYYSLKKNNFIRFYLLNFCINENLDSLWVVQYDTLYLYALQNGSLNKWGLNEIHDFPEDLFSALSPYRPPLMNNNRILLSIYSRTIKSHAPCDVWIELMDGELFFKGYAAYTPFDAPKGYIYPFDNVSRVWLQDSLIYSFGQNDFLYIFKDGVLKDSIKSESKYIKDFKPFPENELGNIPLYRKYETESGFYDMFIYDSNLSTFFRICRHPCKFENPDGSIAQYEDKNWSVQIFNRKLQKTSEYFFDAKIYSLVFFLMDKGIFTLKKQGSIKEDSLNHIKHITYEVFKLTD